jgi:catechol 2,3-dioxygenase-like lactoylglutathione lyase family enzyme
VTEVGYTVRDLDRTVAWFAEQLGAELEETRYTTGPELDALTGLSDAAAETALLRLGNARIALTQYARTEGAYEEPRSNDLTFEHLALVVADMDRAFAALQAAGGWTPVSRGGPQRIPDSNPAAAGIRAFYFREAEGHPLELIWYPDDKGAAAWHRREGPLFLGVDHTAIGVSDRAASRVFYQRLGLEVRGTSYNVGVEQERLSGVPGARVRIEGLGGPSGIGVEFLEYEAPGPGRPRPADLSVRDVRHWEISIAVADLDATVSALRADGVEVVSQRPAACGVCAVGSRAALVRDPDGHVVRLVEVNR